MVEGEKSWLRSTHAASRSTSRGSGLLQASVTVSNTTARQRVIGKPPSCKSGADCGASSFERAFNPTRRNIEMGDRPHGRRAEHAEPHTVACQGPRRERLA